MTGKLSTNVSSWETEFLEPWPDRCGTHIRCMEVKESAGTSHPED